MRITEEFVRHLVNDEVILTETNIYEWCEKHNWDFDALTYLARSFVPGNAAHPAVIGALTAAISTGFEVARATVPEEE